MVKIKLDILVICGFKKPYRLDKNKHGGGVMLYVSEDIPSKITQYFKKYWSHIFVELNLRKIKILPMGTYHSTHPIYVTTVNGYFEQMGFALDDYSSCDKFLLAGDFNVQEDELSIYSFLEELCVKHLVKEVKNIDNWSCIDLFLTNSWHNFQNINTVCTGLSDLRS